MSPRVSDRRELAPLRPAIACVRAATTREWEEAFQAYEHATFFHGPLWSQLWQEYTAGRYRPSPRRVEFSDGIVAVLGLTTERTRLGVERHHLSPAGCYGGWLSADTLSHAHAELLTEEVLRAPSLIWRRGPADREATPVSVPGAIEEATHVVDLGYGTDAARERWTGSARRRVGRARRSGISVREGTSIADWISYDGVYRDAILRWAVPSSLYTRSFFLLLHELRSPHVRLWLAEVDRVPVAGAVVFTSHRHASYWHGASRNSAPPGAANLIHWELLEVLAGEGIQTYDLNPSGGHGGVVSFKQSLGAVTASAPVLVHSHPLERLARSVARRSRKGSTKR